MRKHFLFFLLAACFPFLQMEASENAVKIEPTSLSNGSGTSYSIRFDDKLLGDHEVGSADNDSRTREFTMSVWVKPTNQTGHIMGLVQTEHWTPAPSFCVRFNDKKLELFSRTKNNGSFPDRDAITNVTEETVSIDEWAFVTLVISNVNNKISLYKNGNLVTEGEFKGNQGAGLLPDASVFFVGNQGFEGTVNEIQLWNKALSTEEIKSSMEQSSTPDDLICHYSFDGTETDGVFSNKGAGGECNAEYSKLIVTNRGWYTSVSAAAAPVTFVEGRPATTVNYTVTLPTEVTNGTLTVMNESTPLVGGANQIAEGTELTITPIPASGYVLAYLKVNDTPLTESTYTVTEDVVITVSFSKLTSIDNASAEAVNVRYESGILYVEGMNTGDKFDIYDITGSYVRTSVLPETNVSDLANGYYLAKVFIGNVVKTVKFIKR